MRFQLLWEHGMNDAMFGIGGQALAFEFFLQVIHVLMLCLWCFNGSAVDGLFVKLFGGKCLNLGIDRGGALPVITESDVGGLRGELFPAAKFHVEECLHSNDL